MIQDFMNCYGLCRWYNKGIALGTFGYDKSNTVFRNIAPALRKYFRRQAEEHEAGKQDEI